MSTLLGSVTSSERTQLDTSSFREELLCRLKHREFVHWTNLGTDKDLVSMFAEIESNNPDVAKNANDTLKYLLDNSDFNFHSLVLKSFPIWPVDVPALEAIALKESESNNPIIRKRAEFACNYLFSTNGREVGFATATSLASKKLRDPDEKVQQEGLRYFQMLVECYRSALPKEDLLIAIEVASKMFSKKEVEVWVKANAFFKTLIEKGKEEDVLEIRQFIHAACTSEIASVYNLCDKLVTRTGDGNATDRISIVLEAMSTGNASESMHIRGEALKLAWRLLCFFPGLSLDAVVQSILIESRRESPGIQIFARIKEVAGLDYSNQASSLEKVVNARFKEYSEILFEALTNLSSCDDAFMRKEAAKIKEKLEQRGDLTSEVMGISAVHKALVELKV